LRSDHAMELPTAIIAQTRGKGIVLSDDFRVML
jgi:hypothetical protein